MNSEIIARLHYVEADSMKQPKKGDKKLKIKRHHQTCSPAALLVWQPEHNWISIYIRSSHIRAYRVWYVVKVGLHFPKRCIPLCDRSVSPLDILPFHLALLQLAFLVCRLTFLLRANYFIPQNAEFRNYRGPALWARYSGKYGRMRWRSSTRVGGG